MKIDRNYSSAKTGVSSGAKAEAKVINSLAKGDTFKAVVLDIQKNFIQLRLSDGSTFQAKTLQQLQARIGQEVQFLVSNQDNGQILLEMVKNAPEWETLVPKAALEQAHMELSNENIDMVKGLIQKGMPIDVQSLEKAFFFLNQNVSLEETLFLLQENFPAELKSVELLMNHQRENIKNNIKELLAGLRQNPDTGLFSREETAVIEAVNQLKDQLAALPENERLAFFLGSLPGKGLKEALAQNPSLAKAVIHPARPEEALLLMHEEDLANIQEYYTKLTERLLRFTSGNKNNESLAKEVKMAEKSLQTLEFMGQLGEFKQYIELPLFWNQTQKGELYIFQKKKDNQKLKDNATVLLSLDMAFFGHMEVLVQKNYQNISCQFGADEKWHPFFSKHMPLLKGLLQEKGFQLVNVQYKTLEEAFRIEKEAISVPQNSTKSFSFDMRV